MHMPKLSHVAAPRIPISAPFPFAGGRAGRSGVPRAARRAHHLGMMSVELGEAACLEPSGVRTKAGKLLEAGVVVKAPQLQPWALQAAAPRTQAATPRT